MFITFVYCLFIYFMAEINIKFHILSFGIYAPWNFLQDWILVFGQKSLVQWKNDIHKHTYIELIAKLRTKKDDMSIKKDKNRKKIKTNKNKKRQRDCVVLYIFVFSQHENLTYSYIRSMTTWHIKIKDINVDANNVFLE